jgi:hypothetical protein
MIEQDNYPDCSAKSSILNNILSHQSICHSAIHQEHTRDLDIDSENIDNLDRRRRILKKSLSKLSLVEFVPSQKLDLVRVYNAEITHSQHNKDPTFLNVDNSQQVFIFGTKLWSKEIIDSVKDVDAINDIIHDSDVGNGWCLGEGLDGVKGYLPLSSCKFSNEGYTIRSDINKCNLQEQPCNKPCETPDNVLRRKDSCVKLECGDLSFLKHDGVSSNEIEDQNVSNCEQDQSFISNFSSHHKNIPSLRNRMSVTSFPSLNSSRRIVPSARLMSLFVI